MTGDEEHLLRKVLRMDILGKKEDRTTENKMERRMPTSREKYWAGSYIDGPYHICSPSSAS